MQTVQPAPETGLTVCWPHSDERAVAADLRTLSRGLSRKMDRRPLPAQALNTECEDEKLCDEVINYEYSVVECLADNNTRATFLSLPHSPVIVIQLDKRHHPTSCSLELQEQTTNLAVAGGASI